MGKTQDFIAVAEMLAMASVAVSISAV